MILYLVASGPVKRCVSELPRNGPIPWKRPRPWAQPRAEAPLALAKGAWTAALGTGKATCPGRSSLGFAPGGEFCPGPGVSRRLIRSSRWPRCGNLLCSG